MELSMLYARVKTVSENISSDTSRRLGGAVHLMVDERERAEWKQSVA
jgi:hypothetical protein